MSNKLLIAIYSYLATTCFTDIFAKRVLQKTMEYIARLYVATYT